MEFIKDKTMKHVFKVIYNCNNCGHRFTGYYEKLTLITPRPYTNSVEVQKYQRKDAFSGLDILGGATKVQCPNCELDEVSIVGRYDNVD